jgi:hypothetical protein
MGADNESETTMSRLGGKATAKLMKMNTKANLSHQTGNGKWLHLFLSLTVLQSVCLGELHTTGKPLQATPLKADRALTNDEVSQLVKMVTVMVDARQDDSARVKAAREIGFQIAHESAISALLHVARNQKEPKDLRYMSVTALSWIASKSVVPLLIEFLDDADSNIRHRAVEQLFKLSVGGKVKDREELYHGIRAAKDVRKEAARWWREWWEKNKDEFVFDRGNVLSEW